MRNTQTPNSLIPNSLIPKGMLLAMALAGLAAPGMVGADTALPLLDYPSANQVDEAEPRQSGQTTGTTGTSAGTSGPALDAATESEMDRNRDGMGDASGAGTAGGGIQQSDQMDATEVPSSSQRREALDEVEERRQEGMGAPAMEGTHGGADHNDAYQGDLQTGPGAPQTGEFEQRSGGDTPERIRQYDTPGTNPGAIDN